MTSAAARLSPQTCFRLPHCLGRFAPCGFPRPPALRRADYRLPPVIVLPLWMLLLLVVLFVLSVVVLRFTYYACDILYAVLIILLLVLLYYKE